MYIRSLTVFSEIPMNGNKLDNANNGYLKCTNVFLEKTMNGKEL